MAAVLLALPSAVNAATFRYERARNTIYIENGGSATLSALHAALPHAPLKRVDKDKKIWWLGADLLVANGSALRLHGSAAGGDVDELRLKSDNTNEPGAFVSITADYGFIDIRATRVTSWDALTDAPDAEHETYGRAFIRARSRLRSMVLIPLQSRMDITDSEVAFLGYGYNESYGLVWKVVAPQPYVFDHARVFGDVVRSRIHHNYFGLYTSGAKSSQWRDNEVHHNVQYGMAPHNRSDDLRIEGNKVHHNGHHGITVRQNCARAVIRNNRVWENGESGVTVHRDSNGAQVLGNAIFANRDSGITIYASSHAAVRENRVHRNGANGIQLAMGTADSRVEHNDVGGNRVYGVFVGPGKGRPEGPGQGLPRRNVVASNVIYDSGTEDLRTGDLALNHFSDNTALVNVAPAPKPKPEPAPVAAPVVVAAAPEPRASLFGSLVHLATRLQTWQIPHEILWMSAAVLLLGLKLVGERKDETDR